MAIFTLKRVQRFPVPVEQAWDFFASPQNLKAITPGYMGFDITSEAPVRQGLYAGQILTYTVRPILGIPLFWMTEITHVEALRFFVDDQRVGPYALWHHQHHFEAVEGGVEMTDLVHYRLPLGWLGRIANRLFVRRQLQGIFEYRRRELERLFGTL